MNDDTQVIVHGDDFAKILEQEENVVVGFLVGGTLMYSNEDIKILTRGIAANMHYAYYYLAPGIFVDPVMTELKKYPAIRIYHKGKIIMQMNCDFF